MKIWCFNWYVKCASKCDLWHKHKQKNTYFLLFFIKTHDTHILFFFLHTHPHIVFFEQIKHAGTYSFFFQHKQALAIYSWGQREQSRDCRIFWLISSPRPHIFGSISVINTSTADPGLVHIKNGYVELGLSPLASQLHNLVYYLISQPIWTWMHIPHGCIL